VFSFYIQYIHFQISFAILSPLPFSNN